MNAIDDVDATKANSLKTFAPVNLAGTTIN